MAYRVLIAQFMHETNTFSKLPTTLDDYRKRWLIEGEAMVARFKGTKNEVGGYIDSIARYGWQPVWGAAANATPAAPISAATTTSRPVLIWPSTCTITRSRSLFITSTCCASARPSSQGTPPCLMLVSGDAPVPPSCPEIRITSACAFATPAAIVPTPDTATSFTEMRARGFAFLRS